MIFKHKDGELRIYSGTTAQSKATYPMYIQVLFTDASLSFPLGRGRPEELLNMDRGNFDTNASYSEGSDEPIVNPLPFTFTGKIDDQTYTGYLLDWLSGVTRINNSDLPTSKASSGVTVSTSTVTLKAFADGVKTAYDAEVLWDGSTDYGFKVKEIYFPPDQQTLAEGDDNVSLSVNGLIYGRITRMAAFTSGTTIQN